VEGSILHVAVYYDHHHIVSYVFEEVGQLYGSMREAAEALEPSFFALQYLKYSLVLLLLSKGCDPNQQQREDGNTLLHLCCSRRTPPLQFVKQLLKTKGINPNIKNDEGLTPLHVLCMRSVAPEAADVVKLLKAKGVLLDALTPEGKTAQQLTKNAFVREVLGYSAAGRPREVPVPEPEEEQRIFDMTYEDLSKTSILTPRELRQKEDTRLVKSRKLTQDEQEDLCERMSKQNVKLRQQKLEASYRKYVSDPERSVLSDADIEDFAQRHFYDQVDYRSGKMEALKEKYVQPLVASAQLTDDEVQGSVQRLYAESLESSQAVHRKLAHKFTSEVQRKYKKVSQDQLLESVNRMHNESVQKRKERRQQLYDSYVPPGPFIASRKMTAMQVKQSADRLSVSAKG